MSVPSDYRSMITIDNEPTVELDYSGMHFAIMYAEKGMDIPIEERGDEEVLFMRGWDGEKVSQVRIAPESAKARNPAFDVTPAKYITGIITERGIFKPSEIKNLKNG